MQFLIYVAGLPKTIINYCQQKRFVACYVFILVLLNFITRQSVQAQTADSFEIRKIIAFDRELWKEYYVEKSKFYAKDINWINAFGLEKQGKSEVKAFLNNLFAYRN